MGVSTLSGSSGLCSLGGFGVFADFLFFLGVELLWPLLVKTPEFVMLTDTPEHCIPPLGMLTYVLPDEHWMDPPFELDTLTAPPEMFITETPPEEMLMDW